MSLYRSSVNNPVTVTLVFVTIAIMGVFGLMKLPINLLPSMEANTIMVFTSYSGANAADIETNVSKVLENTLNSVSNLKHITSNSKENISIITLEFEYGIDIDEATNDVRDKLEMVKSYLPEGTGNPFIFKFSMEDMPILMLSATAEESTNALDKILDDKLTTPLARVNGVGTVSVSGAPKREIQIFVEPNKLEAYGLTVEAISGAIAAENRNLPAGNIDVGSDTYSVRIQKEFESAGEMSDIVVGMFNGKAVYLKDVATINDGQQERLQSAFTNGRQGAMIIIQKQTDANAVEVIKGVKKELAKLEKDLPSDVKINTIMDTSDNIINTINSLEETIFITFMLVALVVFVFLGRWRATFIIVLSIPIALVGSLVYLWATGNTLNIISMSALSIAIGMVVDDAIVVLENITSHIDRGAKPMEAAVHATQEVSISVIASTLTMLAVFLPLTMVSGLAGVLFQQLGWIVSIIMIISTSAALTLVPMMCGRMMKLHKSDSKFHKFLFTPIDKGLNALSNGYGRLINWAVTHRKSTVFIAIIIFFVTLVLTLPRLKTEFVPNMDQGRLSITINLPVGTGESVTKELAEELYKKYTDSIPEIVVFNYRYGVADEENAFASMQNNGTHILSMNINLGSKMNRVRSTQEIAEWVRRDLKNNTIISKYSVTEGQGGMGGASSVKLEIYGYDFSEADRVAAELQRQMIESPMFSQVLLSRDEYTPEYHVDFDREKLMLNGIDLTTAATFVRNRINGSIMTYFREDGDEYNVRVRYAPEYRKSKDDIENIVLYGSQGQVVRVKEVAKVIEALTPPTIERKDRERMISVTGIVAKGYALSDGVAETEKYIAQTDIPSEFMVKIAGDYENQKDAFADLFMLLALIIILVYVVMASQFESLVDPFVIMFSVPFAFTGVLIGLVTSNMALGIMAMIGVLILMGIVVKNGIVLIDYTILCRARGMKVNEAVVTASKQRLRPILMTTLTTVLGMVPLAIGTGEGAEMWTSLGVTVAWGLSVSTLITLVLIPTLYAIVLSRREHKELKNAKKLTGNDAIIANL